MQNSLVFIAAAAALIFGIIIVAAIRRRLKHNAIYRRRLAEITTRGPSEIVSKDTGHRYIAPPGFSWDLRPGDKERWATCPGDGVVSREQAERLAQHYRRNYPEVTSLFGRVRSALTQQIIDKADSMSFADLSMAGVQLGMAPEVANAYAREILDEGEPLPAAMLHAPNVGGEGNPEYQGGNYVEPEVIADAMKSIVHYRTERGA